MEASVSNITETQIIMSSTPKENGHQKRSVFSRDVHEKRTPLGKWDNRPKKDNTKSKMDKVPKTKIVHEDQMKVYEDLEAPEKGSAIHCSRFTQTDLCLLDVLDNKETNESNDSGRISATFDEEAFDLMVNENVSDNYWKDLAEERRRALNDTLEENEKLHNEIKQLKEENSRLSDIATQAESLQSLLQELCSDDESGIKELSTVEPEDSGGNGGSCDECIGTSTEKAVVEVSERTSSLYEETPSSSTSSPAAVDVKDSPETAE